MSYTPNYDHCGYLEPVLETDKLRKNSMKAIELIEAFKLDFDAFAFRGVSGALSAPILAVNLNKTMILVRKEEKGEGRSTHSGHKVEGDKAARKYLIVDDFFSTGTTAEAIQTAIKDFAPSARCIGGISMRDVGYYADEVLSTIRRGNRYDIRASIGIVFWHLGENDIGILCPKKEPQQESTIASTKLTYQDQQTDVTAG